MQEGLITASRWSEDNDSKVLSIESQRLKRVRNFRSLVDEPWWRIISVLDKVLNHHVGQLLLGFNQIRSASLYCTFEARPAGATLVISGARFIDVITTKAGKRISHSRLDEVTCFDGIRSRSRGFHHMLASLKFRLQIILSSYTFHLKPGLTLILQQELDVHHQHQDSQEEIWQSTRRGMFWVLINRVLSYSRCSGLTIFFCVCALFCCKSQEHIAGLNDTVQNDQTDKLCHHY